MEGGGLDGRYRTAEFHFHWGDMDDVGSEHAVDGAKYPLEVTTARNFSFLHFSILTFILVFPFLFFFFLPNFSVIPSSFVFSFFFSQIAFLQ